MAKQYDVLFRLLLLGDSGVGKTCMLRRFTEGVDFKMKTIEIDGLRVRVQIWDTAGQERYQTITKQYYRRAQGIIFVYDITDRASFQHIAKWAGDVDENAPDDVQTILVGNKADEECSRQVTKEQGQKLAETYGMEFFEASASTSSNISESFIRVTELVLQAQKRDVDNLLGSLDSYLDQVALQEEKSSQDNHTQRTCAC
ncbi:ras-related protein Rab-15-like isoform X2 [Cyprinodon tularosa]|uniref:ras-related protein Rab-15-like isoform X2 n=2 Tax=Cyprinodon TaxID=28741 RepID=UPI000742BCD1|nr:PREDICTED: ras-related protein Rab-15-like isoform X2 [Cyprinodon variegatus]XP_038147294.1 ras-related protein Rab-15-like isoform X2 [Cyprinodon tularosa]